MNMRFKYKAEKEDSIIEATIEARNRFEVYRTLKSQNMHLISISRLDSGPLSFEYWAQRLGTVPDHSVILFADNLSTMISAGLSLSRALSIAKKQSANPKFKKIISELIQSIEQGDPLYVALTGHREVFSDLFISMVKSGELSGNLPGALKSVAKQMDRVYSLKKKIKGAMIYPSIIVFAVIGVGIFMMTSVVPTLSKMFKEMKVELPYSTRLVMGFSDFIVAHYLLASLISIVFIVTLILFLRTEKGAWFRSKIFLSLPIVSKLTKEINAAYAARTLSSLLKSGIDIVESTNIASDVVQNRYFKTSLKKIAKSLEKGKSFYEALQSYEELYPVMFVELISVGEETGSSSEMMNKVADYYEEEVNEKTKNMSTIVEPFLMLFIGIAVGFFALAMITPMYSITQAI